MENKAFNSSHRFGKWMKKYHLKWGIYKVLGVQAHMRQVQRHVFGRSMIEMLGVLAIIGVLSVGGLYAYRQAMIRHKTNQTLDFIARLLLAVQAECIDKNNCAFYEPDGITRFAQNYEILCGLYGDDFCGKTTGEGMTFYAQFPYSKVKKGVQPRWRFRMMDDSWYFVDLVVSQPELCINLVNYPWKDLKGMAVRDVYRSSVNGALIPADKEELLSSCQYDGAILVTIRWNLKN